VEIRSCDVYFTNSLRYQTRISIFCTYIYIYIYVTFVNKCLYIAFID